MKFKRNLIKVFTVISVLSIQGLFSSCNSELEVVQSINEEFVGINQVEIESGFLDVVYLGDPNMTTIQLDALLESNKSGRFQIDYKVDQGKLIIELDQSGFGNSGRSRGHLYLRGPLEMEMKVEISSGNGKISQVTGDYLDLSAGSGKLTIEQVSTNSISLKAGSGELNVSNLIGDVQVEIGSGSVTMNTILGNVNLKGSSGRYKLIEIEGLVHAKLSSGNIDLSSVKKLGNLEVSSGRIAAVNSGLSAESKFSASSGNIKIQTFTEIAAFNYNLIAGSGKVSVGESSSSGNLKIDNGSPYTVFGAVSSGNIEIRN